jgi:predicted secreted protein
VGECSAKVAKDKTAITLRISVLNKNASESLRLAQGISDILTKGFSELKDDSLEMETVQFSSWERTEWNQELKKSESQGVETNISLEVSSSNRKTIENILQNLPSQTDVNIKILPENLRVYASDAEIQKATEDCMAQAVVNAKDRAQSLAESEGARIGKMISVSYGSDFQSSGPIPIVRTAKAMFDSGAISATDAVVKTSVSAIFELR